MDLDFLLMRFYAQGDCCSVRSFQAAVLFLDISGFTGSMERFDNAAPNGRGIEKFWSMINSYYASLLDIIVRYAAKPGELLLMIILPSHVGTLIFPFTFFPLFRYGGDVECFAGDAMPVIFDAQQLYDRVRPFLRPTSKEGENGQDESFPSPLEVSRYIIRYLAS